MRLSRTAGITLARVDPALSMAIVRRLRDARLGPTEGPCGGTGRRARLKIEFRKECWFDSGQGHQPTLLRSFGLAGQRTAPISRNSRKTCRRIPAASSRLSCGIPEDAPLKYRNRTYAYRLVC